MMTTEPSATLADVARRSGVANGSFHRWIEAKHLLACGDRRLWKLTIPDVGEHLQAHRVSGEPAVPELQP